MAVDYREGLAGRAGGRQARDNRGPESGDGGGRQEGAVPGNWNFIPQAIGEPLCVFRRTKLYKYKGGNIRGRQTNLKSAKRTGLVRKSELHALLMGM